MSSFKPMLSATYKQPSDLTYPAMVSPKLDGIRCLIINGVAVSRTLKPIPNKYVQQLFGKEEYNGLDGELIVGSPTDPNCMQNTSSGVMSIEGRPDVRFHVFDRTDCPGAAFAIRYYSLAERLAAAALVVQVPHRMAANHEAVLQFEEQMVAEGYEGIMARSPSAPYKYGRATLREGGLIKIKRFSDSEGSIIGFEEKRTNANEAEIDNLGHTKRSLKQGGMVPAGTLGVLLIADPAWADPVRVGSGFTAGQAAHIWANQPAYVGKLWKYKYFDHGVKEAPRHAVSLGERYVEDL